MRSVATIPAGLSNVNIEADWRGLQLLHIIDHCAVCDPQPDHAMVSNVGYLSNSSTREFALTHLKMFYPKLHQLLLKKGLAQFLLDNGKNMDIFRSLGAKWIVENRPCYF